MNLIASLFISIIIILKSIDCYEVPPALVEPLSPHGLRVSIPDSENVTLFAFHGKLNEDFDGGKEAGQEGMNIDITRKKNGRWTFINRNIKLKQGDILYYWLYVIQNGLGYERLWQSHTVTEFFDANNQPVTIPDQHLVTPPSVETTTKQCKTSHTTVNGSPYCSGKLLFDAQFTNGMHKDLINIVQISGEENEFVVFNKSDVNYYIQDGNLVINPTLLDENTEENFTSHGHLDLSSSCTNSEVSDDFCARRPYGRFFLPPVVSARVTTKDTFWFRYGVVEIKAKLPQGDWLLPELWLFPKYKRYGQQSSGRMIIASSFGNRQLTSDGKETGNKRLFAGLQVNGTITSFTSEKQEGWWGDDFHSFKMIWAPDRISFYADNREYGSWKSNDNSPFLSGSDKEKIAPFNEEFYLVLGLQAAGSHFPEGSVSNGHQKPWRMVQADLMKRFYDDRVNWLRTWGFGKQLKIKHVKVWSL